MDFLSLSLSLPPPDRPSMVMAIVMLMLLRFVIYALCIREDIILLQLWYWFFLGAFLKFVDLPRPLLAFWVPTRNVRDFCLFHANSNLNWPSAMWATAANSVCSDFDSFRKQICTCRCDIIFSVISYGIVMNCLSMVLCFVIVYSMSSVYGALLFWFVCCAVFRIGHSTVHSAR